ncbi:MAG: VOC family protein [Actinomycetota bacterium]|nr:VOC family protein [Actinomycetota bacterium]
MSCPRWRCPISGGNGGTEDGGEQLRFDHVILAVGDLDAAAERISGATGLGSVPGGRHAGLGTGNRIIPLGPDYIELMGIVDADEAAGSPLGRWVAERLAVGEGPAAFCLGTGDTEAVARRLKLSPEPMERIAPDGSSLGWRLAGLEATMTDPCKPFFIQWDVPPDSHPGRMVAPHQAPTHGISWVEVSGDSDVISTWIGAGALDVRIVPGDAGLVGFGVGTTDGELVLR